MSKKLTTQTFIHRSHQVHGQKYDYSRANYGGADIPVEIICPLHGAFFQKAIVHTSGHGCRKCGDEKTRQAKIKKEDWPTIKRLLNRAIRELDGRFPSHSDVVKRGWWEIDRVTKKLGGYRAARLRFGFKEREKAKRYWDDLDNVGSYLKKHFPALLKSGQCPTHEMMIATGEYPSFVYRHGGVPGICKKLNLVPAVGFQTRDGHFVRSFFEVLLDEYLFSREIEHTPEVRPFKDNRLRCDQKVGNYYIELWGYSEVTVYEKRRKEKEELYRRHGLRLISIEKKLFLTTVRTIEERFDDLLAPLGFSVSKKKPFSMRSIARAVTYPWNEETVRTHIGSYVSRYGEFPTQTKLNGAGMSGFAARIRQFGGFPYFRSLMEFSRWQPKRKWNEENITARLSGICERLGRFPKDSELSSDLRNAIRKNSADGSHKLNYYRQKLGYPITKEYTGHWTEYTIEKELKRIVGANGVFPTNSFLREHDRYDLSAAIQKSGGFNVWRQKLGYPIIQHSPNQYDENSLKEWLRKVTFEKGGVPTQKELRRLDAKKQAALAHRGGVTHFLTSLADKDLSIRGYVDSYLRRNGGHRGKHHF